MKHLTNIVCNYKPSDMNTKINSELNLGSNDDGEYNKLNISRKCSSVYKIPHLQWDNTFVIANFVDYMKLEN